MNFHRIISCLTLTLCLLLISGCTKKECTYELAEDYELDEIYFNLTFGDDDDYYGWDVIPIEFGMYALDDRGDKIPLMAQNVSNINIRYAGKSCDSFYDSFDLSCGKETLDIPGKKPHYNVYECYVDTRDIPANAVFTASYQRGETTVWASLRWPGIVSDIQIQGVANPDAWDPAVSLTEDMHVSWDLPGEGQPEALRVNLDREAESSMEPLVPLFEETLRGDATGIIIPKSVFADILASGSAATVHLSVSSIVSNESAPLLAGASVQSARTIWKKDIEMLPCEADKIDTYFDECSGNFFQAFYCRSDESVNPESADD